MYKQDGRGGYRYDSNGSCPVCEDNYREDDDGNAIICRECYIGEYVEAYRDHRCDFVPKCDTVGCTGCSPVEYGEGRGYSDDDDEDDEEFYRPVETAETVNGTVGTPVPAGRSMSDSEAFNFHAFNTWEVIETIAGANVDKLLLWGPPATGKSTLSQTVGLGGRKCYPLTMTEEMPAEAIRGHYISVGNEFRWMDGMGTKAMRVNPITNIAGRFVVNELHKACGDALDILHVYCDDPTVAELTLPKEDLEVLKPGFGYQVFATMNGDPSTLDEALQSRFPATIHVSDVNEGAIRRLPEDLQAVARASSIDNNRRVDIRKWIMFASLREKTNAQLAAFACFGRDGASVLAQIEMSH